MNGSDASRGLRGALDRRDLLRHAGTGLTGIALGQLLARDLWAAPAQGTTHHAPRARQVLQIFCPGGVSHVDLWEHKPALEKFHGTPLPGESNLLSFQGKNGNLMKSPWPFQRHGGSGKMLSSLLPHMG